MVGVVDCGLAGSGRSCEDESYGKFEHRLVVSDTVCAIIQGMDITVNKSEQRIWVGHCHCRYTVENDGCWHVVRKFGKGTNKPVLNGKYLAQWLSGWNAWPEMALHRCNNYLCVNPEHLYLGSHKENYEDRFLPGGDLSEC